MKKIKLSIEGSVATIKFNHPETLNAIDHEMLKEFQDALINIHASEQPARCLLLTGEGKAFCAGTNLQENAAEPSSNNLGTTLRQDYHPILLALRNLNMPIVTAVNGPAAGIGMSFAMMGDIIYASKQAYFLQAYSRIGLVPDGGATFMLPRLIGWGRAMEFSLLAEPLKAEKAEQWGLVNQLFDNQNALMDGANKLSQRLANGPQSLSLIRRMYWQTWQNSFETQLQLESEYQEHACETADHKEGMTAFNEKRLPNFTGT